MGVQLKEAGHQGCVLEIYTVSLISSHLSLLSGRCEVGSLLLPRAPHHVFCLTTGPETIEPSAYALKLLRSGGKNQPSLFYTVSLRHLS